MRAKCPECGEDLPLTGGPCEVCRLVASMLTGGDDTPPLSTGVDAAGEEFEDQRADASSLPLVATILPAPLPLPLDDPMRTLRPLLVCSMAVTALLGLREATATDWRDPSPVPLNLFVGGLLFLFAVWRLLPSRAPDILYLRSFQFDSNTALLRTDLQRAFGRQVRLSGIRDPRRRWPRIIRYIDLFLFSLRYSTPKYLNLESGEDWKARLWRSLGEARGAVIDLSNLTSYVIDEMWLCLRSMGLDRILFVGSESKTAEEWREAIAAILQLPEDARIRLVVWKHGTEVRNRFRGEVRAFALELPGLPRALQPAGSELTVRPSRLGDPARQPRNLLWLEMILGSGLSVLFTLLLRRVLEVMNLAGTIGLLFALLVPISYLLVTLRHFIVYQKDCGSNRERLLSFTTFGLAYFAIIAPVTLSGYLKVQDAMARAKSADNLKQIGMAMRAYETEYGHPMSADGNRDDLAPTQSAPAVSWRVRLLPLIARAQGGEEGELAARVFREYRQSEPWDSPHNIRHVEMMPKVFRHPTRKTVPPGHTHYRVFVSPVNASGPQALFRSGMRGPSLDGLLFGPNPILVVEAAESVPWTKPALTRNS